MDNRTGIFSETETGFRSPSIETLREWNRITEIVRDRFRDELARLGYTPREITEVAAGKQILRFPSGKNSIADQRRINMESAKLIIEVSAGIVPGMPMFEHTRRWSFTGADHEALNSGDKAAQEKWIRINGESREYAATLENPKALNWVRRDWVWL